MRALKLVGPLLALLAAAAAANPGTAGAVCQTTFPRNIAPSGGYLGLQMGPIISGPDGNMWFEERQTGPGSITFSHIGRISPSGAVSWSDPNTGPWVVSSLTSGPDGNVWFSGSWGGPSPPTNRPLSIIGRITPAGAETDFPAAAVSVATGPDGAVWFTQANAVGRITTSGQVSVFSAGISPQAGLGQITTGPDGNLWFVESTANRIGRITPSGQVTEFSAGISPGAKPDSITAGPDGNLWFTESGGLRIGRITPGGIVTEFSAGLESNARPTGIIRGPDGALWFIEQAGATAYGIGRITTAGQVNQYSKGTVPDAIASGPDGNIWFTQTSNVGPLNRIGRVAPSGSCPSVRIVYKRAFVSRRGNLSVKLGCGTGALGCQGTLNLTARRRIGNTKRFRTVTLASAPYLLGPRTAGRVAVQLTRAGRRLLQGAPGHRLTVTVTASGARRRVTLILR